MGIVTKIIDILESEEKHTFDSEKIKLTLDEDFSIESLEIDKQVKLDEEDISTLGPFFWREFLRRHGYKIDFKEGDISSLTFTDEKFEYKLHLETLENNLELFKIGNNPFMSYHFTNTYQHDNINHIRNVDSVNFGHYIGYVTIQEKGKEVILSYLKDEDVQQIMYAISFLHKNNIVYGDLLSNSTFTIINNKIKLNNFNYAKRSSETNRDIVALGILLRKRELDDIDEDFDVEFKSKFNSLIDKMIKGSINIDNSIKEFEKIAELKEYTPKSKIKDNVRYLPKNFALCNSSFVKYLFETADICYHILYDERNYLLDAFHLFSRVHHKFDKTEIPYLAHAIMVLVASYYGFMPTINYVDKHIFNIILLIIKLTKGILFYHNNPKDEGVEYYIPKMEIVTNVSLAFKLIKQF